MTAATDNRKPVRLAGAALTAALTQDWEKTAYYIQRINDECGAVGLELALRAWCDTYTDHSTDGRPGPGAPEVNFIRTDNGQLDQRGSDRVPAHVLWSGELMRARATLDYDSWARLINELPDNPIAIGEHVFAVVQGVALTMNGLPRGYARMGRDTA